MDITDLINEYKELRTTSTLDEETFDEKFESQFEGEFMSMTDKEYNTFWETVKHQ
jgi:hypothetical protein